MRFHRVTGGLLVVFSVIEGSSDMLEASTGVVLPRAVTLTLVSISLIVAVLAAMQAFMSFETRSRLHYIAGGKYGAIKRQLEAKLAADPSGKAIIQGMEELGKEWDALTEDSEPIPLSIWDATRKKEQPEEENKAEAVAQAKKSANSLATDR